MRKSASAGGLIGLDVHLDPRGDLVVGEFLKQIPFEPKRFFFIQNVPGPELRGEHAHRVCEQFLICVRGELNAIIDDGSTRSEFVLNKPDKGLYMPAMTWGTQYRYSSDAMLLVFASHHYDPDDYIREYQEFLNELPSF